MRDEMLEQLLAEIENNPELRQTLRRHFLTEEVLKLPENFAQFAHAALDFYKLLADRTEQMVNGMTSMAETITSEAGQLERLTGVFAAVSVTLNSIESEVRGLSGVLGLVARESYARQSARRALRLARAAFALAKPTVAHLYTDDGGDFLFDLAADAEAEGRLTAEQAQDLEQAAMVLAATDDRGTTTYVLAEIALTAQPGDVANARRRASLLWQATGARTLPAIIAAAITDEAQTAAANGVTLLPVPLSGAGNGNEPA